MGRGNPPPKKKCLPCSYKAFHTFQLYSIRNLKTFSILLMKKLEYLKEYFHTLCPFLRRLFPLGKKIAGEKVEALFPICSAWNCMEQHNLFHVNYTNPISDKLGQAPRSNSCHMYCAFWPLNILFKSFSDCQMWLKLVPQSHKEITSKKSVSTTMGNKGFSLLNVSIHKCLFFPSTITKLLLFSHINKKECYNLFKQSKGSKRLLWHDSSGIKLEAAKACGPLPNPSCN